MIFTIDCILIIPYTYIFTRLIIFRVQTADCQPESSWAKFEREVAIKKFDKTQFYAKVKYKCFTKEEVEEESEKTDPKWDQLKNIKFNNN